MKLIRFIFDIFNVFTKASELRRDEEIRSKTVGFAISSIVYSLIAVGAVLIGALSFSIWEASGILMIFVIVITIALFAGGVVTFIGALLRLIAQFTLNRKPMTWIALVVFILAIIAAVLIISHFA